MKNIFHKVRHKVRNILWKRKREKYKLEEEKENESVVYSQVTYYATGNAGDTVLSQCVRRMFEREQLSLGWNLITVTSPVTSKMIFEINRTQALVIGGGGLFLPDTNANTISGWEWAISQEQLADIYIPIIIFSVGYNYFVGQKPNDCFRENLQALCEKAEFIGLRNHGSVEVVKSLLPEILEKKIVYQPCTTTLIRKIYGDQLSPKQRSKKVAFNLAFDRAERRYVGHQDEICIAIARAAKEIECRGYEIVVVAHCDGDEKIIPYLKQVGVHYSFKNLSREFPMKVYQFYNGVECVIGMRGHAQMIPFGLNCEIISLGSHNKIRWFLEDIDAIDWYIDLIQEREHLTEIIFEKFITVHERESEKVQQRLLAAQEYLWEITQNNMKKINEYLK